MKKCKKLAALLLALIMVAALAVPAMAAENDGDVDDAAATTAEVKTATLSTTSSGHTFTAYQIFKAAPADGSSLVESTIEWSDSVNPQTLIDALRAAYEDIFDNVISGNANSAATAQNVAAVLSENFTTPGSKYNTVADNAALAEVIANSGAFSHEYQFDSDLAVDVQTGYCLIIDESSSGTSYMLQVITGNTAITAKKSDTTLTKEVWERADNAEGGVWSDGAIYAVGEEIEFKLTVTLPDDIKDTKYTNTDNGKGYWFILHDKQGEGLDFNGISSVTLYNKAGVAQTTVSYELTENPDDGCTFEVYIENVQTLVGAEAGGYIEVVYTAELNGDAVIGALGNPNEVSMETEDGDVPGDEVKVFELELTVDKVDGDGNPLTGAEFTLYYTDDNGDKIDTDHDAYVEGENDPIVMAVDENGTHFSITGLKAGTYILEETEVPDGYNKMADITIKIDASTVETTGPEAGKLVVDVNEASGFAANDGIISSEIANLRGTQLPETGGIGTTIFYIVGGLLAVGAVVLLITKRRVGSTDDK